jgi:hypothetical protein
VTSETSLTATVPAGATTGRVTVTTPNRTLVSNADFRIRQRSAFSPPQLQTPRHSVPPAVETPHAPSQTPPG